MRYFDHNATYPLSPAARAAWLDAVERFPANPSSPHRWGSRAAKALDDARSRLAHSLGCSDSEIVWTSGATESNNAVLHHLARTTRGTILVSAIEHPSIRQAARAWLGERCRFLPVSAYGVLDLDAFRYQLRAGPVGAVAVMAANNETGALQPWTEIARDCRTAGVPFLCDAAQWIGKLPSSGMAVCDFVTGCAHKFGGPVGVGFIKCPPGFVPLLAGGPQEDRRRAGTENVPAIVALASALEERESAFSNSASDSGSVTGGGSGSGRGSGPGAIASRLAIRDAFLEALRISLPGVEVVGSAADRLWNTVAVLMPPAADCRRRWVVKLDRLGFAASTGSACASGKEQPSHVLAAMGYRPDESDRMLRFTSGWETTSEDWSDLLAALKLAAVELVC